MDYRVWIEFLRNKLEKTDLGKDILDTWNELMKSPFNRASAETQAKNNNTKYPEIYAAIAALPTTVMCSYSEAADLDIWHNLKYQLDALIAKEAEQVWRGE